eukprot:COSAG06_NODE_9946_length_1784_cov_2.132344_1_plen_96_part_00
MFPSALAAASSAEQSAEERAAAAVRITLTLCSYHLLLPGETIVLPRQARDENVHSISQLNKESGVFFLSQAIATPRLPVLPEWGCVRIDHRSVSA